MALLSAKKKAVISGMLGNGLEWYDYALYGHMSIIISKLFLPKDDPNALTITFLIFASGFIVRPLGAILFGRLGDKYGRKKALVASMILMAIPTGAIGLLPTYAQIGIAAPILLLVIRMLQGLSLGGAYSGSISYVVEHADANQRSTVGCVIKVSLVIGFLIGAMVSTVISKLIGETAFQEWGWRLPFFLGVLIGVVGYYIRHHGEESPVYQHAKEHGHLSPNPVRDTFNLHFPKMLRAFTIYLFVTIPFYLIAIYMIAFSTKYLGLTEDDALLANSISMACMMVLIYPAARMGDKIGRRPVLMGAILAMLLFLYPAAQMLATREFTSIVIALSVMAMILGWYLATIPAVLVEIFPTSIRSTGMALAYNCCAILGGLSPAASEWIINRTGNPESIFWLIVVAGSASLVALATYKDRWREPLPE